MNVVSDKKAVKINWAKWNRLRFIESVKCFFGFHDWYEYQTEPFRFVLAFKKCHNCNKEVFVDSDD